MIMSTDFDNGHYSDATMEKEGGNWLLSEILSRYPSQAEFARAAGVRPQYVSNWVSGKIDLSVDFLPAVAHALFHDPRLVARKMGIPLPGEIPEPRSPEDILAELEANQPVAVPVIRDVVAHMGAGGGFIDDYVFLPPVYRKRRSKNILSLIARGHCMAPQIEDGDIVVFDKDAPWKANDIVVAGIDGLAVIRRLVEVGGKPMLRADADGSTHAFSGVESIFGRVIYVMRPLLAME